VARCLEKDAHRRLHDIADARIEIADALDGSEPDKSSGRFRPVVRHLAAAAALAAISLALGWWVRGAPPPRSPQLTRFTWTLPQGMRLESPPAVSLDGRLVAFTASTEGAASQLYVRLLSDVDATAIPRTEGAQHPFWSPDNRSVAYFARGRLMRVAVDGGAPKEISTAVNPRGGAWSRNGVIVFAPDSIYAGLSRVSENGGPVEPATLLDATQGENAHRWPTFLPDGIHFLYFVRSIHAERRGVYLGRIDRAAAAPGAPLFRSESEAGYAPRGDGGGGVLLSVAGGHIDVHPFDARRLVVTGDPTTMALPAGGNTPRHASTLSASPNLLSVVASAIPYGDRLASSSRDGDQRHIEEHRSLVSWPRVSPDGRRLVVQRLDSTSGSPDLWIEDLTRGTRLRVTEAGTSGQLAVWSPDGARLAYVAAAAGKQALTIAAADGTGVLSTIACPRARCEPTDWSPDGRWLLVNVLDRGISDVWMLSTTGSDPRPLLIGAFAERDACFSSDGNLVAYVSEEVGQPEVSVRTLDAAPRREVISVGGGTQPVWSNGGNELLFVDLKGVLQSAAVRWTSDGRLRVSSASRLNGLTIGTGHYGTQYDVSPDGQRIYYLDRQPAPPVREITLILGWQELLR
jgi:Tol biopolymer transport system component